MFERPPQNKLKNKEEISWFICSFSLKCLNASDLKEETLFNNSTFLNHDIDSASVLIASLRSQNLKSDLCKLLGINSNSLGLYSNQIAVVASNEQVLSETVRVAILHLLGDILGSANTKNRVNSHWVLEDILIELDLKVQFSDLLSVSGEGKGEIVELSALGEGGGTEHGFGNHVLIIVIIIKASDNQVLVIK